MDVWRILEAILNQAGETIFIEAEHAMFGFPEQKPNNPVNTMILFTKRILCSCKFSGIIPNVNTLLRQVKEVSKVQIIKNQKLGIKYPSWPATVYEELAGLEETAKPA